MECQTSYLDWKASIFSRTEFPVAVAAAVAAEALTSPEAESKEPRGEARDEFVVAPSDP